MNILKRILSNWAADVKFEIIADGICAITPLSPAGRKFIPHVNGVRAKSGGKIISPCNLEHYYDLALHLGLTCERID